MKLNYSVEAIVMVVYNCSTLRQKQLWLCTAYLKMTAVNKGHKHNTSEESCRYGEDASSSLNTVQKEDGNENLHCKT